MQLEELFNEYYDQLNENDREILKRILSDTKKYSNYSSAALSEACHISRATLLRVCRKIGLTSFSDLKRMLKNSDDPEMADESLSFDKTCEIYHYLIDEVNRRPYREICRVLYECDTIYIYGTGNEQKTLADEFKRIFLSAGKLVIELFDFGEVAFMRKAFKPTDLFVVISLSGETPEGIRILNIVASTDIQRLSITRLQNNTISRQCQHNLYVATQVVENQVPYELIAVFYVLLEFLLVRYLEYAGEVQDEN